MMNRIAFILLLLLQVVLTACSRNEPPSAIAIIRVTLGNASPAGTNTSTAPTNSNINFVNEVFESYDIAQDANKTLGLAKLWSDSDQQVVGKIRGSVSVQKGNASDLFDVKIRGIDHDLAVKIINEMCGDFCSMHLSASLNGGVVEEVHASIVQAAQ